jgi:3-oxoacyl-[acyl-carrier protein] reductase
MIDAGLRDRVVLITGGNHGIGAATPRASAEQGARDLIMYLRLSGPVQTGYITRVGEKELQSDISLRRIGEPRDIADAIVFVASEMGRWITGQVIKVSGGHAI